MEKAIEWLRRRIRERLFLAEHAIELGCNAEWIEQSTGVLVTGEPPEGSADVWFGTWAMGDSTLTRLMEANDPRDTIARCEAELAILDACAGAIKAGRIPDGATWSDDAAGAEVGTDVLRLLASGYKYRDGWAERWGEA